MSKVFLTKFHSMSRIPFQPRDMASRPVISIHVDIFPLFGKRPKRLYPPLSSSSRVNIARLLIAFFLHTLLPFNLSLRRTHTHAPSLSLSLFLALPLHYFSSFPLKKILGPVQSPQLVINRDPDE